MFPSKQIMLNQKSMHKLVKLKYDTYLFITKRAKQVIPLIISILIIFLFTFKFINFSKSITPMEDEIYNFINHKVDECLELKTRYEQNKHFSNIKSNLPIRPLKMTLNTAVFYNTETDTVLKRIIINKKAPIYEDKIALKMNHENVVKSYRSEIRTYKDKNKETQTILWLYMEYLPVKLDQNSISQDEDKIRNVAFDLLKGLNYLHMNDIAHLDLKISNIMGFRIDDKINYKIIDMGYSREIKDEVQIPSKNYGTFPYKPPENVLRNIHGKKGDIWCVGAILLFLRMGQTPFYTKDNKRHKELYDRFIVGDYKIKYPSDISEELKDLIKACMQLNRHKRPTTDELLQHRFFNKENGLLFGYSESSEYYDSGYETSDESVEFTSEL